MKLFSAPVRLVGALITVAAIGSSPVSTSIALAQSNPDAEDLRPIPGGPGIQICEPLAPGSAPLADFGAGCGLWLQWSMGFQPQLGQTPRWEIANRACREMHLPRLRLSLAQASRLVPIMGVTHIAVGQITGTEAKCLLTYQLYAAPNHKPIGAPIKLVGTEEQVITKLPQAARALLTGLGIRTSHVPASVGATPLELRAIGHYGWYQDQRPTDAEQQQIDTLGQKLPLATMLSFVHKAVIGAKLEEVAAQHMLEQGTGNFLMLGILASFDTRHSDEFNRPMDSQVAALAAPNNSVLAYWASDRTHTRGEYVRAIQRLVRLAPNSSTSWNNLSHTYADEAGSIRRGRVYADLSEQESQTLTTLYARWMHAAARATALDPDYVDGWLELAIAATFAGASERADSAFWKALSLDKGNVGICEVPHPQGVGLPLSTRAAHRGESDALSRGS